ncbi:hypothetical protein B9W68_00725 [Streptomyces sp. CS227]|nr:hypothetical protein B9W68_00725 [Streptomyces sp. CS227]
MRWVGGRPGDGHGVAQAGAEFPQGFRLGQRGWRCGAEQRLRGGDVGPGVERAQCGGFRGDRCVRDRLHTQGRHLGRLGQPLRHLRERVRALAPAHPLAVERSTVGRGVRSATSYR